MTAGELESGVVFRFGLRSAEDMFFAERRKPLVSDFELGSEEIEHAKVTKFAALSVWNEDLTTVTQAQQFIAPNRRLPIWLSVEAIRALPYKLHVLREPHPDPLPGREGHCNVGNVWSDDRMTRKKIRSDLRDLASCERDEALMGRGGAG